MVLYNVVFLGDGGVGKSALIIQFVRNLFCSEYDATIENSYRKQITVDDDVAMLDILDTAGQEDYSAMRDQYIQTGQGFVLVYSVTNRGSFEVLKSHYERICEVKDYDNAPVVILGNKVDLVNQRQISTKEAEEFAASLSSPHVRFMETSAKSRVNIEEAFIELVRLMRRQQGTEAKQPQQREQQQQQQQQSQQQRQQTAKSESGRRSSEPVVKKKSSSSCLLL